MSALQGRLTEATPAVSDAEASAAGGDTLILPALSDEPGPAVTPSPEPQPENPAGPRRYMDVEGTRAPVDDRLADSRFDYERYTTVAGPLARPRWDEPYQVQYRGIHHSKREWLATRLIALVLVALDVRFIFWL